MHHREGVSSGVMHLAAQWNPRGLDQYNIESWSQPDVHDSASAEIMAGEAATANAPQSLI